MPSLEQMLGDMAEAKKYFCGDRFSGTRFLGTTANNDTLFAVLGGYFDKTGHTVGLIVLRGLFGKENHTTDASAFRVDTDYHPVSTTPDGTNAWGFDLTARRESGMSAGRLLVPRCSDNACFFNGEALTRIEFEDVQKADMARAAEDAVETTRRSIITLSTGRL